MTTVRCVTLFFCLLAVALAGCTVAEQDASEVGETFERGIPVEVASSRMIPPPIPLALNSNELPNAPKMRLSAAHLTAGMSGPETPWSF